MADKELSGGPKFENGTTLMQKMKSKFSTLILPIIAALILATGIFLYYQMQPDGQTEPQVADQNQQENGSADQLANLLNLEQQTGSASVKSDSTTPDKSVFAESNSATPDKDETSVTVSQEVAPQPEVLPLTEQNQELEEISTPRVIRKIASPGEGVTNLARRALATYLEENSELSLSKEQKIFVEDYLKDRTGSQPLEPGQSIEFDRQTINQAVEMAQNLTAQQLEVISQFSPLVSDI